MESPSTYRFPPTETRPLHPLSPERVNATRPTSATTTTATTTKNSSVTDQEFNTEGFISPPSSPLRKAKANLFGDQNYLPPDSPSNRVSGFTLPLSPSLPEIHNLRSHVRTNSDVQGLVKRFEHLDVRDRDAESAERRKRFEAELRRAQMAREEAESDVKRLREETRRLKKECDEGRERERKVAKRLEVVMEEYAVSKESTSSQSVVYEKELRKARKEAFKSSSSVVKLQEELKSARNSLRATQSGLDLEKQKIQRKEQERFEMEYQLIPLQEEIERLKQQLKVSEEEKAALQTSLKGEEVALVVSKGMIAVPFVHEPDKDRASPSRKSPQKRVLSPLSDNKENIHFTPIKMQETIDLTVELEHERMRRERAEEMAEFLKMECMFKCCRCRASARLNQHFDMVLDSEMVTKIEEVRIDIADTLDRSEHVNEKNEDMMELEVTPITSAEMIPDSVNDIQSDNQQQSNEHHDVLVDTDEAERNEVSREEDRMPDSPSHQLLREEEEAPTAPQPTPVETVEATGASLQHPASRTGFDAQSPSESLLSDTPFQRPQCTTPFRTHPSIRTITTTTTIPMQFTPVAKQRQPPALMNVDMEDAENIPPSATEPLATPTFDRDAALAAIAYRRGRARSIANGTATPRKQMLEGVKERRDISAPALGQKAGSGAIMNGTASVGRSGGRARMG